VEALWFGVFERVPIRPADERRDWMIFMHAKKVYRATKTSHKV